MLRNSRFEVARLSLAASLVLSVALVGCSSDNDDDDGPADETSMPAPGTVPDAPPSATPGGDTSAVAGLWVVPGGRTDTSYVYITEDGLWTRYDVDGESENCFTIDGPYTLTLELAETDGYSLAGEDEVLTLRRDGDALTYRLGDGAENTWPAVNGQTTVIDLESQACDAG